ncbi:hypothetical protein AGRA3207_005186 [Actinomadura graeca]|uniref:Uncharacterized protein n=1 Tax=Actinomadura graeca TaxID=2750812 RepID=A0ABX8R2M5_9ACTN|nr:hypothetical protein [Actinomadura graeca]QXJ23952.1 hypothetical protein AGRA3207_005186 [Actinomadura graeca]
MSLESGMPMHLAGTAMTWGSVWLFPNLIPLGVWMTLGTSNPGMIDAAGTHWEDAKKKIDEYDTSINDIKKQFDADPTNWTADDKLFFDSAVEKYLGELKKVHDTVDTVEGLVKAVAKILFGLCIAVLTIGGAVLAIALFTIAQLPIPVVGEIAYSMAQTAALMLMEVSIPIFTTIQGFLMTLLGFITTALGIAGGTYGTQLISLGTSNPDFKEVKIEMPSGPLK